MHNFIVPDLVIDVSSTYIIGTLPIIYCDRSHKILTEEPLHYFINIRHSVCNVSSMFTLRLFIGFMFVPFKFVFYSYVVRKI